MSAFNFNEPQVGTRDDFKLDLTQLNAALAVNSSVGPVSAAGMASVLSLASQITRIPLEFFEVILELEASYPTRAVYASTMPRDGDGKKRLPDPRYPHPSSWSARPPGKSGTGKYYGLANVNANTQIYIGVTQMSFDFWQDVRASLLDAGVKREYLPSTWWTAPLLIQVLAPLVYFKRYGSSYSRSALVTPATVYMLHQQGPGWVQNGLGDLAGKQSVRTSAIVTAARKAARGYF